MSCLLLIANYVHTIGSVVQESLVNIDRDEGQLDWGSARVLDRACGEGAFLAPVARRIAGSLKETSEVKAKPNGRAPYSGRCLDDGLRILVSPRLLNGNLVATAPGADDRDRPGREVTDRFQASIRSAGVGSEIGNRDRSHSGTLNGAWARSASRSSCRASATSV